MATLLSRFVMFYHQLYEQWKQGLSLISLAPNLCSSTSPFQESEDHNQDFGAGLMGANHKAPEAEAGCGLVKSWLENILPSTDLPVEGVSSSSWEEYKQD